MSREFRIEKQVDLGATPGEVWEAIATEAGQAAWLWPSPIDPSSDVVQAWDPPRKLVIRLPDAPDGAFQAFEYLIEGRDGASTVLRFVHSGMLERDWSDEYESITAGGWDMYLYTLAQYFEHFPGRQAVYIVADGPASSSAPAAWPTLATALGLDPSAALGTPVDVSLPGAGAGGVVDYMTAGYIGVRSPDALIRFHDRSSLGMAVAVSHHHYDPGLDAAAIQASWATWLADAFSGRPATPTAHR
ncbi:MAG TPA: SRPBCC domain-containing protein [Acidimicrobiales bacterium]|nr:SRPBCC domain-containing protein [Acidimicrobiales bacterium]